jgi:hypothetical protein
MRFEFYPVRFGKGAGTEGIGGFSARIDENSSGLKKTLLSVGDDN